MKMIPQSTVLITGGTGFLNIHLTHYFLKKKYKPPNKYIKKKIKSYVYKIKV
jgi:hypothetical protein